MAFNAATFDVAFESWYGGDRAIPLQLGINMFTPMAMYATIGVTTEGGRFYQHQLSTSPVYVAPWAERFDDIVKENSYELGTEATFTKRTSSYKTYKVDNQLTVSEVLSGLEEETSAFRLVNHVLSEAGRNLALKDEKIFLNAVKEQGSCFSRDASEKFVFDKNCLVYENGKLDIVKTIYKLVAYLRSTKNNWRREDMIIYMTPELTQRYSLSNVLTNNGVSSFWANNIVHKGYVGTIAGIKIIEVPTLEDFSFVDGSNPMENMIICNTAPWQIFSLSRPQGRNVLRVTGPTERHLDANDLYVKGMLYIGWGLKNQNSAFWGVCAEESK